MDIKNLSSNWKKLQPTLEKDKSRVPKRKPSEDDVLQPQPNGVKRVKLALKKPFQGLEHVRNRQKQGMGIVPSQQKQSKPSASLATWAEDNDISAKDLTAAYGSSSTLSVPASKYEDKINEGLSSSKDVGKYISIDCEMVGVGPAPGRESALARVSIANYHGQQIYDSFVQTKEPVADYRTFVSGITPQLLKDGRTFESVQADVAQLLNGKILVGHAVKHDLEALLLGHPKRDIRDTSKYPAYRKVAGGRTPGLKRLAKQILDVDIQTGEHSSIEDARAAMSLFRREKEGFEREHQKNWGAPRNTEAPAGSKKGRGKTKKRKKKK
ncbi:MAG: hypothetical protein LQ350_000447 [Teloschistes chrysophthalmus]|nr:MAG: hypothetical protein LQ350_000447 [Niorma chrysophthalma]